MPNRRFMSRSRRAPRRKMTWNATQTDLAQVATGAGVVRTVALFAASTGTNLNRTVIRIVGTMSAVVAAPLTADPIYMGIYWRNEAAEILNPSTGSDISKGDWMWWTMHPQYIGPDANTLSLASTFTSNIDIKVKRSMKDSANQIVAAIFCPEAFVSLIGLRLLSMAP